jgi:valyl-tRNA synthetase
MVNWAPTLQTAVSDLEVEYSDEPGTLYYFDYPVEKEEGADAEAPVPVATSRPETILGDTAVAVNPTDERFKHLIGKRCRVPFTDPPRYVPIVGDEHVEVEFGTGALKVTPGHDPNDYEMAKRKGLEVINIMNKNGTMNGACGKYEGMDRFACREQIWKDMLEAGLGVKTEPYATRVPRSQRGGEIIEPLVSEQWFCKMESLAERALAASENGELVIIPQRFEKIYRGWLTDTRDWCVSRQLWWGHRIPVYYVHPDETALAAARSGTGKGASSTYVVARNETEARAKAKALFPDLPDSMVVYQEEDVLDTWFSSGLWPFSTLGWPDDDAEDLKKFFPTTVMETGHDILFFWVARMVMLSYGMTGKLPFSTVFLHGLVRDEKGRKMSKSLGNVVDPLDVIAEQGCDALRFTLATGTAAGQDLNLNADRLSSNRNFTNKIWNAGKFVLFALDGMTDDERMALVAEAESLGDAATTREAFAAKRLPLPSVWILSRLHQVIDHVTAAHDRYDFGEAGRAAYAFFYDDFADWFIEASKARLYGAEADAEEKRQIKVVALRVLEQTLTLLHPFVPYVTEEVWRSLPHRGETLMLQSWPARHGAVDQEAIDQFELGRDIVRAIRNARAEYGVEPVRRVSAFVVVADDDARNALAAEHITLAALARLDVRDASDPSSFLMKTRPPEVEADFGKFAQRAVADGAEVFLPLSGMLDPKKETERLAKQSEKIVKERDGLAGRLASPAFLKKAPKDVVEKSEKELAELNERLAIAAARMEQMRALLEG